MLKGRAIAGCVRRRMSRVQMGGQPGFDRYFDELRSQQVRAVSCRRSRGRQRSARQGSPWIDEPKGAPFFAWIHLYDPHSPYRPPEPFASRYKGHPYNGEIAFADSQVGRLVSLLESRGLYDHTVIVVMGDHGESLGEHGEGSHGFFVYNSVTHVPFVIRAPFSQTANRRVADPVRSVDVMPTVLDLRGAPPPRNVRH